MLILGSHARRRVELHRRRVPVGVRQDQPRDARPDDAGLEGRDRRRRHRWMKFGADGRLYAINPEAGFFGVAPGTSDETNPNAMDTLRGNTHLHQPALTADGDVWWEGMTDDAARAPHRLAGQRLDARVEHAGRAPERALHGAGGAVPVDRARVGGPHGVPISAILFGGRRARRCRSSTRRTTGSTACSSARSWRRRRPPPQQGAVGELRRDPFAMLPFCGYNMGDYFAHWLGIGRGDRSAKLPKIFYVNWFRKDADGKFLWPGFGENSRVLKWVFERWPAAASRRDAHRHAADQGGDRHRRPRDRRRRARQDVVGRREGWK